MEKMTVTPKVIEGREVDEQLRKVFADPRSARAFFEAMIAARVEAHRRFAEKLGKDEDLATAFRSHPIQVLRERELLQPLDKFTFEMKLAPAEELLQLPGRPEPPGRRCQTVWRMEQFAVPTGEWVCTTYPYPPGGFGFCRPRLRIA